MTDLDQYLLALNMKCLYKKAYYHTEIYIYIY